jgi:hypothetical protein
MEPILTEKGLTLQLDLDPALPPFPFDPDHIRQVILNLLKNSVEALDQPGTISVVSRSSPENILVHIADTGPGIPLTFWLKFSSLSFPPNPGAQVWVWPSPNRSWPPTREKFIFPATSAKAPGSPYRFQFTNENEFLKK